MKLSEALTWNELADLYDKTHFSRPARTLSMEMVFNWAAKQKDKFHVDEKEETVHIILWTKT